MSTHDCQPFGVGPVLPVNDVQATVAYYCEQLGFTYDLLWGEPPTHGSVTRNSVGIQFTKARDTYRPTDYPGWTYIFVTNVDDLFAEYRANGVTISSELTSHDHGMREFDITDLNGYTLRFGQYLSD